MSKIETKIRELLEGVEQKTAAQLAYPGATNPQDPMPQMGIPVEYVEADRPSVELTQEIQQVEFPGQAQQDPMALAPEFEELDPYDPAGDIVPNMGKESYPVGSGAEDVALPPFDPNAEDPEQYAKGIQPAQHPAPFVAESKEDQSRGGYVIYVPKKVSAKAEGKIIPLDSTSLKSVERKLGIKSGELAAKDGQYGKTLVIKGQDGKKHTIYAAVEKDKDGKEKHVARIRAYGHKDEDSSEALQKHLAEAAEDQPQPQQDNQEDQMQQAIAAVQVGNPVDEVAKAIGVDPKVLQDAVDSAKPASSPTAPVTTAPVSESEVTKPEVQLSCNESDLKKDVESILGEETLSEEFKEKATSLFEAAVIARVNDEAQKLEEAFSEKLSKEVQTLQEQYVQAVETFADKQSTRLNNYINYLGEQWIKSNKVAVEQGIRTQLAESFMKGIHNLFNEHNVSVPQEKLDLVEETNKEMETIKESLQSLQEQLETLQEEKKVLEREAIITKLSEGLTDTECSKLHSLCEGIAFESADLFESKLEMIKKNFFSKKSAPSPEQLIESAILDNQPHDDEQKAKTIVPANMQKYVAALDRMKGF